jgi:hypothetical protein
MVVVVGWTVAHGSVTSRTHHWIDKNKTW